MYDAFKKVTEITGKAITNGIKYNGTIEQLQTSFEVMTGSADKAREIKEKLLKLPYIQAELGRNNEAVELV